MVVRAGYKAGPQQADFLTRGNSGEPGKRGVLSIRPSRERGYKLKCGGLFSENSEGKPKMRELHRRPDFNKKRGWR